MPEKVTDTRSRKVIKFPIPQKTKTTSDNLTALNYPQAAPRNENV